MVRNKFLILIMALSISMFILTGCFQSGINNANKVDDKNKNGTEQTDDTETNNNQTDDNQTDDTQTNDDLKDITMAEDLKFTLVK